MFKEIMQGFSKFFTKEKVLVLLLFVLLAWALYAYSGSKSGFYEGAEDGSAHVMQHSAQPAVPAKQGPPVQPENMSNNVPSGFSTQNVANPVDLLPKDTNSQWSALNPSSMNKGDILMPDLLQAGYHIGLDTIGQTLRNPNLQLRSDPVIQKQDIGPWNQSTIEPDLGRVPLELGAK
jgi:hypothetical protein